MSAPEDPPFAETLPAPDAAIAPTIAASQGARAAAAPPRDEPPMGRYEIREELGRGGMGRVRVALDTELGREVALKDLLGAGGQGVSVAHTARFVREARVTGRLEHPNIVPVHELGRTAAGAHYYTMKRIRGRSLAAALREAKTLRERLLLLDSFRHVADAIAYAHSRGVIHRDLKPDNVMLGDFGETLVVDWGIAKVDGESEVRANDTLLENASQTVDGAAIGTPAYMSPEQARGDLDAIDARSDVWGLGAILFEILTGRPPFVGPNMMAVLAQALEATPPPVRRLEPHAPAELAAIAERALARDPASRYASAGDLATDVAAWQAGRNVAAYDYSAWERVRRFALRHRAASTAIGLIVLTVVGASVAVSRSWLAEQGARARAETALGDARMEAEHAARSDLESRTSLAEALLERAERAHADRDFLSAAIWAAAAMVRDPARPDGADDDRRRLDDDERAAGRQRRLRAISVWLEAEETRTAEVERTVSGMAFDSAISADGRWFGHPIEGGVGIMDLDGETERALRSEGVSSVLGVLDESRVVVGGSGAGVYDIDSGRSLLPIAGAARAGRGGDLLAITTTAGEAIVFDAASLRELDRFALGSGRDGSELTSTPVLSADGHTLALIHLPTRTVEVTPWPRTGTLVRLSLPSTPLGVALSPDGSRIAIGVAEPALLFGAVVSGLAPTPIPSIGWTMGPAWTSIGPVAINEGNTALGLRDPLTGALTEQFPMPRATGGRLVAGGSRIVRLPAGGLRTPRASVVRIRAARRSELRASAAIGGLALDAREHRLLALAGDEVLAIGIANGGLDEATSIADVPAEAGFLERLAIAPDGALAVVTSTDTVLVWDHERTPQVGATAPRTTLYSFLPIAFDGSGERIFVASRSGTPRIREYNRAAVEQGAIDPATGIVFGLATSPDGAYLASTHDDGSARLWRLPDATVERTMTGHAGLAGGVAFSPDGASLATGDGAGTLRIFDVANGTLRCSIRAHDEWINDLAFSSDGMLIATASDDRSVRVVRSDCSEVVRIVRTQDSAITVLWVGRDLVFPDGVRLVRIPALSADLDRAPEALLADAERRAGMRLEGSTLVAIGETEP